MIYTTEGGTVFLAKDGLIEISRVDDGKSITISVPVDDLEQFCEAFFNDSSDDDDEADAAE